MVKNSSFFTFDISRIPPSEFEDMIISPFVRIAVERGGLNLTGNVKFKKENGGNWTQLLMPTGGYVKFTHLYRVNSQMFKEDQGGIQIFPEKDASLTLERMDNVLREFAAYCYHELNIQGKVVEQKKSGCYIATAVYGSYDAPEVRVLRRFRDDVLAESIFGRAFIQLYYWLSPPIAKWLKDTRRINTTVRHALDRLTKRL